MGNNLYIADSSPDWVYEYDLDTHEGSVFEELSGLDVVTFDVDYSNGDLHRVNIYTGGYELLTDGLNDPRDIEYIPVDLPLTR